MSLFLVPKKLCALLEVFLCTQARQSDATLTNGKHKQNLTVVATILIAAADNPTW